MHCFWSSSVSRLIGFRRGRKEHHDHMNTSLRKDRKLTGFCFTLPSIFERKKHYVMFYSWSSGECNERSHWLIYGQVALAKS